MRTRFLRPAAAEVEEAIAYFDEQRDGLGDRFEHDLQDTVTLLLEYPLTGKIITKRVRKFRLATFSYNVIYVPDIEADEIVIVAVAHHRRRPGYWRPRLVR